MSTFVNIELYDGWRELDETISWQREVILFYHCLYPGWMLGLALERLMKQAKTALGPPLYYEWKSSRVGALLIKWAAEESVFNQKGTRHPTPFEPCLDLHGSSKYLWRIFLDRYEEGYDIQCYQLRRVNDAIADIEVVNWRKEAQDLQLV